jgi:hypothetical protein
MAPELQIFSLFCNSMHAQENSFFRYYKLLTMGINHIAK